MSIPSSTFNQHLHAVASQLPRDDSDTIPAEILEYYKSYAAINLSPQFTATAIVCFLFGTYMIQLYLYSKYIWIKDKTVVHCAVVIVTAGIVASTVSTGFGVANILAALSTYPPVEPYPFTWIPRYLVVGVVGGVAQSCLALRFYHLTRKLWIPLIVWVAAVAQFGCWIARIVTQAKANAQLITHEISSTDLILFGTFSLVADSLNTVSLTWWLHIHQSSFSRTNDVITRIIRLTFQTSAITCLWVIVWLVAFRMNTDTDLNHYWSMLCETMPLLYGNCLLSLLNARVQRNTEHPTSLTGFIRSGSISQYSAQNSAKGAVTAEKAHSRRPIVTVVRDFMHAEPSLSDVERGGTNLAKTNSHDASENGPGFAFEKSLQPNKSSSSVSHAV